jgi:hypothetical protein
MNQSERLTSDPTHFNKDSDKLKAILQKKELLDMKNPNKQRLMAKEILDRQEKVEKKQADEEKKK